MKLKQSIRDLLCYSESIYVHFRPNNRTLQELWTFAWVMTSRKAVYSHCEKRALVDEVACGAGTKSMQIINN